LTTSIKELEVIVEGCLDEFYRRRLQKLNGLKLKDTLKRKNPYLFRAIGTEKAQDIVEGLLSAYMSSSDEGIFGDAFFEPLAKDVSGGTVAPSEGVDVAVETDKRYLAVAVKSGPAVFNADSKKRQGQNFEALRKRVLKLYKGFDPLVGYCYGRKKTGKNSSAPFRELAGQAFWEELTGDPDFYLKIIKVMKNRPAKHKAEFKEAWAKAVNRFTREFIDDFCEEDGSIKWEALTKFNSGKEVS
jgi:hypothetical protein